MMDIIKDDYDSELLDIIKDDYDSELLDIIELAKSIESNAKYPYVDPPFNPAHEIERMAKIIQILARHIRYNKK